MSAANTIPVSAVVDLVRRTAGLSIEDFALTERAMYGPQLAIPFSPGNQPNFNVETTPIEKAQWRMNNQIGKQASVSVFGNVVKCRSYTGMMTFKQNGKPTPRRTYVSERQIWHDGLAFRMSIWNELTQTVVTGNWDAIKANSTLFAQIKDKYNKYDFAPKENPSDVDLIVFMSTGFWTFLYKPLQFTSDDIKVLVDFTPNPSGGALMQVQAVVDGVPTDSIDIHNQIYPKLPIFGFPNEKRYCDVGSAHFFGSTKLIDTDQRNRRAYHVLNPKALEVLSSCTLKDSIGNNVYANNLDENGKRVVLDLSNLLPTFDYFGRG